MNDYINVDSEGFLVNPTSIDNISEDWMQIIGEVISVSKKIYGDNLHSLYVRGSVPRGTSTDYSDLNVLCVAKDKDKIRLVEEVDKEEIDWLITKNKVNYNVIYLNEIDSNTEYSLKIHCLCIFGEDLIPNIRKFSLKDMINVGKTLDDIDDEFYEYASYGLTGIPTDNDKKDLCVWISKNILRSAYKIVMLREKKYTTNLQLCYSGYYKYYPDSSELLTDFLEYISNPIADLELLSDKWVDAKDLLDSQYEDRTLD